MSVIIDFQGFHARHLAVFQQYIRTKKQSLQPIVQTRVKISAIKANTMGVGRAIAERRAFLAPEYIGASVDLLI